MADILIRMEMPKDCYTCRFRTTVGLDEWMCMVNKMRFPSWESGWNGDTYRHENCPLVELPEHGDLIDRDAFREENEYYLHREFINPKYEDTLDDLLKDAPIIVPSNKEDAE